MIAIVNTGALKSIDLLLTNNTLFCLLLSSTSVGSLFVKWQYLTFCGTSQVQHLPFLHSSNLSLDILKGNYDCLGFEDILNGKHLSKIWRKLKCVDSCKKDRSVQYSRQIIKNSALLLTQQQYLFMLSPSVSLQI